MNFPHFFCKKTKNVLYLQRQKRIVPLCNGSTAGFGSVSLGSNPSGTTFDAQVVKLVYTLVSGTSGFTAV